jgi:hypothetical protein
MKPTQFSRVCPICQNLTYHKSLKALTLAIKANKSCGCVRVKLLVARCRKHGLYKSPEYKAWSAIRERCCNPGQEMFHHYGGRGILMCERWKNSFQEFFKDMGFRPTPKHTIERKNNNSGYNKNNCIWATRKAQQNNRRNNLMFHWKGKCMTLAQICDLENLKYSHIRNRIQVFGYSIEEAVHTPRYKKIK